jgi:hypothetical protein
MLVINGGMMLKVAGKFVSPGEQLDLPDNLADKLIRTGLVTATIEPAQERAVMPEAKGGGKRESSNTTNRGANKPGRGKKPSKD